MDGRNGERGMGGIDGGNGEGRWGEMEQMVNIDDKKSFVYQKKFVILQNLSKAG